MPEYRIKGALFENERDSGPAFTGFVEIDGVKSMIALWPKVSAKGARYLQVSEDKKKANATSSTPPASSPFKPRKPIGNDARGDMDDDIPF
jgi:hypothetical protein